jgi:hypothetical protein
MKQEVSPRFCRSQLSFVCFLRTTLFRFLESEWLRCLLSKMRTSLLQNSTNIETKTEVKGKLNGRQIIECQIFMKRLNKKITSILTLHPTFSLSIK